MDELRRKKPANPLDITGLFFLGRSVLRAPPFPERLLVARGRTGVGRGGPPYCDGAALDFRQLGAEARRTVVVTVSRARPPPDREGQPAQLQAHFPPLQREGRQQVLPPIMIDWGVTRFGGGGVGLAAFDLVWIEDYGEEGKQIIQVISRGCA